MSLLTLRAIGLPLLFGGCLIALIFVRERIQPPERGFLVAFWGSTSLLFAFIVATVVLLSADETPAQLAGDAPFILIVGACAVLSLVLGLALGWHVRIKGVRFLIALAHPPADVKFLRGWAFLPVVFLWFALTMGTFAATYGLLSRLRLGG